MMITAFVALRVGRVGAKVEGVHDLVNSEMTKFRDNIQALADAQRKLVFHAGQQDVRDSNRGTTVAAAKATEGAAVAVTAAAVATAAAVELTGLTTPAPPSS